jgi:hypothetical protein
MSYIRSKLHELFNILEKWSIESINPNRVTLKAVATSLVCAGILMARIMANAL